MTAPQSPAELAARIREHLAEHDCSKTFTSPEANLLRECLAVLEAAGEPVAWLDPADLTILHSRNAEGPRRSSMGATLARAESGTFTTPVYTHAVHVPAYERPRPPVKCQTDERFSAFRARLAAGEREEPGVVWPQTSLTNFNDDIYNAIPEPPMQAGTVCPLCGDAKSHAHTAREVVIFRNGEKRGRSIGR